MIRLVRQEAGPRRQDSYPRRAAQIGRVKMTTGISASIVEQHPANHRRAAPLPLWFGGLILTEPPQDTREHRAELFRPERAESPDRSHVRIG